MKFFVGYYVFLALAYSAMGYATQNPLTPTDHKELEFVQLEYEVNQLKKAVAILRLRVEKLEGMP